MRVICVDNSGYPVSLTEGESYEVVPTSPDTPSMIAVVDDSGEAYMFEKARFRPVEE